MYTTSGLSILLHNIISLPDVTSYDKSVNYFSVMSERFPVFLSWIGTKQPIKCLAQLATMQSPFYALQSHSPIY